MTHTPPQSPSAFRFGIRGRLIALVLIAIMPALAIVLYQAEQLRRVAAADAEREVLNRAQGIATRLARVPETVRLLFEVATQVPQPTANDGTQCPAFLSYLRTNSISIVPFAIISIANLNGDLICNGQSGPVANVKDRPYYKQAMETRQFAISPYLLSRITGLPNIAFAQPLVSPAGDVTSMVVASVGLDVLANETTKDLPNGGILTVFDQNGTILVRSPDQKPWIGKQVPDPEILQQAKTQGGAGVLNVAGTDGIKRIYGISPIEIGPNRLFVSIGFNEAEVFSKVDAVRLRGLASLAVVGLLALGAAWTLGNRLVVRPVRELIDGAERLAGGDLAAQVPVRGNNELSDLATSFNSMSSALREQQALTEQARKEQEAVEAQLRQAQKMEAVGQLTGGVAHDFNNLLTIILGNSEILVDELTADPGQRKMAETIFNAAERGAGLTQLMLSFARRQPMDPSTFELNGLVEKMGTLMSRTIGADIDIKFDLADGIGKVTTDPRQLETALLNLVVNARDAMPDGGGLTIETSDVDVSEDYAAQNIGITPGRYVLLALSDTGSGIPPDILNRVLEPFFTTKEVGKGTGLGLSMVYGFVKQSNGHLKIYSEVGHGTTIKIYLPRADSEPLIESPATQPSEQDLTGGESILVVEDDPDVRTFAVQQLCRMGYNVREATDGPSALNKIAEDGSIDLLFTDVIMPGGMTGRQLADRLKDTHPEIRVLFTSGYTENSINHHGRLDPGVVLLQKPYRLDQLARKVRQVLDA